MTAPKRCSEHADCIGGPCMKVAPKLTEAQRKVLHQIEIGEWYRAPAGMHTRVWTRLLRTTKAAGFWRTKSIEAGSRVLTDAGRAALKGGDK